jgi:hypothetical protein
MTRFHIGVGSKASFIGSATNCPKCNRTSEIIPGVYDATVDRLNILIDRSITPEALGEIRRITERLQQGKISVPQAKVEAEKISPDAGQLFDIANWSDQAKATLYAAIIGAVAIVVAARMASPPNQTVKVQPVIERVIQEEKPSLKNDLESSSAITPPKTPVPRRKAKPPS